MRRKIILLLLIVGILFDTNLTGQVTIGSGSNPNLGALLDLKENNSMGANSARGLALPRVLLDSLSMTGNNSNLATTIKNTDASAVWNTDEHVGLTIYNTNEPNACIGGAYKGAYVWDGSQWLELWSKKPTRPPLGNGTDQYEGANTYIVQRGVTIDIPVKRAFDIWTDYSGNDASIGQVLNKTLFANFDNPAGNMSVSVVWEECEDATTTPGSLISSIGLKNSSTGSGIDDYITVTTGNTHTGNALIALKVNNIVIWQWQIWVPMDDPTTKAYVYNTGYYSYWFMDRDLGAVSTERKQWDGGTSGTGGTATNRNSHGLFYQWGRPTPFKKFGVTVPSIPANSGNESENLQTALRTHYFITSGMAGETPVGNVATEDWYSDVNQWLTRWGDGTNNDSGNKTAFDPCPKGWRMPARKGGNSPWLCLGNSLKRYSAQNGGYDFSDLGRDIGYLPLSGYRVRAIATLYDVGTMGALWSATPGLLDGKGSGQRIYLTPTLINPTSSHYRANALSVRCVQDY